MSKNRQSVWKMYPELTEYLIECIVKDGLLYGKRLLESILKEAKKLGIKEKITIHSVQGKKVHLIKTNNEVGAKFKEQAQKELLEGRHALKDAVLAGRWLSILGIEENIDFRQYIPKDTIPGDFFKIKVANSKTPTIVSINAPLVGSLVEPDENKDVFHNALRYSDKIKADCVLITGDLIFLLTQKWGTQKPRKASVVGIEPDPGIVKQSYPPVVLDEKSIEDRIKDKDAVFTSVKTRLDLVMKELFRVFTNENGKPVFSGPVYIVFGELEEEISTHYAGEIVRLIVAKEKNSSQQNIDLLRYELKYEDDERKRSTINKAISEWSQYKDVIVSMSSMDNSQVKDIAEQMVGYLVKQVQEAVPNSVVVGRGDAYILAGEKKIYVTRGKATTAYTGTSAGNVREKTYTHIKGNPGLNIPDIILVAGLNPYWIGLYASHAIPELAGTLKERHMTHIIQLPTALSAGRYRQALRNFSKIKGPIDKVAEVSDFESGATVIRWEEPGEFLVPEVLKSEFLTNEEIFNSNGNIDAVVSGDEYRSRIIYSQKQGCEHVGARFITQYPSLNDPDGRIIKTHFQVVYEAFIRSNSPIHLFQSDGDTLHWANYAVHKEGFPDSRLSMEEFLDEMKRISNFKKISLKKRQKLMEYLAHSHVLSEGLLQPDKQLDFYQYLLKPYINFFLSIIQRVKDTGMVIIGPRLGPILQGQGNHNENSFRQGNVNISEAEFVRRGILLELLSVSSPDEHDFIKDSVVAGVFSDIGEARGMFGIPLNQNKKKEYTREEILRLPNNNGNDYFYALYMMHKQGGSKTKDNMAPMIRAFRNRLTNDQYEANRFSINEAGDDHTGGWACTRTALHVKSGCQMGGNSFGRKTSFPEQNIFSAVWGVPVGGPRWGPMKVIVFDQRFALNYADTPYDLPVDTLFSNPA